MSESVLPGNFDPITALRSLLPRDYIVWEAAPVAEQRVGMASRFTKLIHDIGFVFGFTEAHDPSPVDKTHGPPRISPPSAYLIVCPGESAGNLKLNLNDAMGWKAFERGSSITVLKVHAYNIRYIVDDQQLRATIQEAFASHQKVCNERANGGWYGKGHSRTGKQPTRDGWFGYARVKEFWALTK